MKRLYFSIVTLALSLILFTGCHDCPPTENHEVTVDAGVNQVIQLPADSTVLQGTVLTGLTSPMTYAWTQLSGPGTAIFSTNSLTTTGVYGMTAGTYVFQFAATNTYGNTGIDTVSITLTSAPIQTVNMQPSNNVNETMMVQTIPDNFNDPLAIETLAAAWTNGGNMFNVRSMLQFDLTSIPAGSTIVSAQLTLYVDSTPINGNFVDPNFGTTNQMYVARIIEPWTNTTLWQDQPAVDAATQLLVPQSLSSFEDVTNLDVTSLVQPMVSGDNYGFKIYLQNEVTYNSRIYCSSKYANAARHPKLVVIYY
ncbi:MAG: DNRLRE domain-containing protein [Ferruginibacter sp.]